MSINATASRTATPVMTEKDQQRIEDAAKSLKTAMKGIGTDEDRIIIELCKFKNAERQQIKSKYMTLYGKSLEEDIKSELSGQFQEATLAFITPSTDYDSKCIHKSFGLAKSDEKLLIDIICTKDAKEMKQLRDAYKHLYNKSVDEEIKKDVSGDFRKLLRALLSCGRGENHGFEQDVVKKEAQELYDAGKGKTGTDEDEFIRIMSSRSFPQLYSTFAVYGEQFRVDIEESVKSEMSGSLRDGLLAIVKCVRNRPAYFAEKINETMKGIGAKEEPLIRLIISRAEIDLDAIKNEYERLYKISLYDNIKAELKGDLRNLFLEILGGKF